MNVDKFLDAESLTRREQIFLSSSHMLSTADSKTNALQGLGKKRHMRQMLMILPVKSENPGKLSSSMWQASIRLLKRVPTGSSGCPTQPSKLVIEVMLLWGSSV